MFSFTFLELLLLLFAVFSGAFDDLPELLGVFGI